MKYSEIKKRILSYIRSANYTSFCLALAITAGCLIMAFIVDSFVIRVPKNQIIKTQREKTTTYLAPRITEDQAQQEEPISGIKPSPKSTYIDRSSFYSKKPANSISTTKSYSEPKKVVYKKNAMYTWIDNKGIEHFSNIAPPAGTKYSVKALPD